jgi:hypothetical protein
MNKYEELMDKANNWIRNQEMSVKSRFLVAFSKETAEFLAKTVNSENFVEYLENLIKKDMEEKAEKEKAEDRIREFMEQNGRICIGKNNEGKYDIMDCYQWDGFSYDAHLEPISFEEVAGLGASYLTSSERLELVKKIISLSNLPSDLPSDLPFSYP